MTGEDSASVMEKLEDVETLAIVLILNKIKARPTLASESDLWWEATLATGAAISPISRNF